MRKMLQHLGVGITTGTFIGLLVSFIISWNVGTGKYYPGTPEFMAKFNTEIEALGWSIVLWSGLGLMFSLANLIFRKDRWPIVKQTIIHFTCTYVGFLFFNVLLSWYDYTVEDLTRFTLIFICIYTSIYIYTMLKVKFSVDEINEKLSKRGGKNDINH